MATSSPRSRTSEGTAPVNAGPVFPDVSGEMVTAMVLFGNNRALAPEESESWTVGLDFASSDLPGTALSVTYFDIKYTGRIRSAFPGGYDPFQALLDPEYGVAITRDPDDAAVAQFLTAPLAQCFAAGFASLPCESIAPGDVVAIVDARLRNLNAIRVDGVDLTASYQRDSEVGQWLFQFGGSYLLNSREALIPDVPEINAINDVWRPVDLRLRSSVGWARGPLSMTAYVNWGHVMALAPDGTALAYIVTSSTTKRSTLYVKELDRGTTVALPGEALPSMELPVNEGMTRPVWSADGQKLAYFSIDANADAHLNVWDRPTGRHRVFTDRLACTDICMMNSGIEWFRDGSRIYFLALNEAVRARLPNAYRATAWVIEERSRLTLRDPDGEGVTVLTHPPKAEERRLYGHPYHAPLDVVVVDLTSARTDVLLTGPNVKHITLSPDGKKLLAIAMDRWAAHARQAFHDLYLLEVPSRVTGETKSSEGRTRDGSGRVVLPVLKDIKQFHAAGRASWSPSSRYFAHSEQGALAAGDVFVYDTVERALNNLTKQIDLEPQMFEREFASSSTQASRSFAFPGKFGQKYRSPLWSSDGRRLYLLRSAGADGSQDDDGDQLWKIDIRSKKARVLTDVSEFAVQHVVHVRDEVQTFRDRLLLAGKLGDGQAAFALLDSESRLEVLKRYPLKARFAYGGVAVTNAASDPVIAFAAESRKSRSRCTPSTRGRGSSASRLISTKP